ncbi:helix-turn-helix domain-containing protein [Candidatus Uabimicrobium sp. HlEnr_7]|uniref:helix-turn-helix domain-containing protein n=1 Tax=Candidatus Uabimicrobium helgolandensis TaxID=3095367 RepID=UPI0035573FF8
MDNKDKLCMIFGATVRKFREEKDISQEKFAAYAELHRTYFGGIERGERNPTLVSIVRIADALDISLEELFREFDVQRKDIL